MYQVVENWGYDWTSRDVWGWFEAGASVVAVLKVKRVEDRGRTLWLGGAAMHTCGFEADGAPFDDVRGSHIAHG